MTWDWFRKKLTNEERERKEAARIPESIEAKNHLPVVYEAFREIRETLQDMIVKTDITDTAKREACYHQIKALDAVVAKVEQIANYHVTAEAIRKARGE